MKRLLFVGALALLASGCASQMAWKYGPEAASTSPVLVDRAVAVPPFDDQRLNENSNKIALYAIPLMP